MEVKSQEKILPKDAGGCRHQTFRYGLFAEMQTAARAERCIQLQMLSKRTQIESWLKIMVHESSFRGLRVEGGD